MEKNVANQIWIIYAWDETNHTAKAGDAANITANLRIDGAGANAVDDVNPTELENGYYYFDITQAESNGDYILICPSSATVNIHVEGCPKTFTTTAPNSNLLGIAADGDLTKVNTLDGHTAQTGDGFAVVNHATHGNAKLVRSTTPANTLDIANGASESDLTYAMGTILTEGAAGRLAAALTKLFDVAAPVLTAESVNQSANNNIILAHADYGLAKLVRSTTPANKLDVSATGEAGLDFDNIKNATSAHNLSNITVPICTFNTDMRGTDNAPAGAVWTIDRADDIEAVKVITDQISFDGSGNVQSSITRPTGSVVADASNGASGFVTDLSETDDDYWAGGPWVKFTAGALTGQVKKVFSYNGTTKFLSFTSAYTGTPAGGDAFDIIVE